MSAINYSDILQAKAKMVLGAFASVLPNLGLTEYQHAPSALVPETAFADFAKLTGQGFTVDVTGQYANSDLSDVLNSSQNLDVNESPDTSNWTLEDFNQRFDAGWFQTLDQPNVAPALQAPSPVAQDSQPIPTFNSIAATAVPHVPLVPNAGNASWGPLSDLNVSLAARGHSSLLDAPSALANPSFAWAVGGNTLLPGSPGRSLSPLGDLSWTPLLPLSSILNTGFVYQPDLASWDMGEPPAINMGDCNGLDSMMDQYATSHTTQMNAAALQQPLNWDPPYPEHIPLDNVDFISAQSAPILPVATQTPPPSDYSILANSPLDSPATTPATTQGPCMPVATTPSKSPSPARSRGGTPGDTTRKARQEREAERDLISKRTRSLRQSCTPPLSPAAPSDRLSSSPTHSSSRQSPVVIDVSLEADVPSPPKRARTKAYTGELGSRAPHVIRISRQSFKIAGQRKEVRNFLASIRIPSPPITKIPETLEEKEAEFTRMAAWIRDSSAYQLLVGSMQKEDQMHMQRRMVAQATREFYPQALQTINGDSRPPATARASSTRPNVSQKRKYDSYEGSEDSDSQSRESDTSSTHEHRHRHQAEATPTPHVPGFTTTGPLTRTQVRRIYLKVASRRCHWGAGSGSKFNDGHNTQCTFVENAKSQLSLWEHIRAVHDPIVKANGKIDCQLPGCDAEVSCKSMHGHTNMAKHADHNPEKVYVACWTCGESWGGWLDTPKARRHFETTNKRPHPCPQTFMLCQKERTWGVGGGVDE